MNPVDAPVRPVQCSQCGSWCLLGQCDGFKTIVSAQPLTLDGYRAALLAGLGVYGLSTTRKLRMVHPGGWNYGQRLLAHPCKAFADVPLKAPEKPVQSRVPCSAMCAGSCELCDPPPFRTAVPKRDAVALLIEELGARVVSIEIHGKEVYRDESLA